MDIPSRLNSPISPTYATEYPPSSSELDPALDPDLLPALNDEYVLSRLVEANTAPFVADTPAQVYERNNVADDIPTYDAHLFFEGTAPFEFASASDMAFYREIHEELSFNEWSWQQTGDCYATAANLMPYRL
jgi:hypothetical protein